MSNNKHDKLLKLSPLAAAIAFSVGAPVQLQADKFIITSQDELDDAIEAINDGDTSSSNKIVFASSLSGERLSMDGIYIYGGDISIDGTAAKNLTLLTLERNNYVGVDAAFESSVTLSNLNIVEGANGSRGLVVHANYDSDVHISNTHFTSLSIGSPYSEGVIEAEGSNVTINDSSFSDLSGPALSFSNKYTENDETISLSISNTTFDNMYSYGVIGIGTKYRGSKITSVTIDNVSINANKGNGIIVSALSSNYQDDKQLDLTLTNTSFTNNESEGSVLQLSAISFDEYRATINANIANVTVANNITADAGAVFANVTSFESEGGIARINLNMAHSTIVNNTAYANDDDEAEGFGGPGLSLDTKYSAEEEKYTGEINANIVNTIISGNSFSEREYSEEEESYSLVTVEADIHSNTEMNVNNSLIGVEYIAESEGSMLVGEANLFNVDPKLGALKSEGGVGLTMSPKSGSPAINAGDVDFAEVLGDILLASDQRGKKRVQGKAPDMGAVEIGSSKSSSGSLGFGGLIAGLGLLGLRKKRK